MDREQFVNGDEIVDYWGYLKSVSVSVLFHTNFIRFEEAKKKIKKSIQIQLTTNLRMRQIRTNNSRCK